jgi:MoxR-like ATPase
MQEHSVTVGGVTRRLPEPYFVLATQNPIEQEGTYPLPEAQLDRFLFKLLVPFPTLAELNGIMDMTVTSDEIIAEAVAGGEDILLLRSVARQVPVARAVQDFALKLVLSTHPEIAQSPEQSRKYLRFGASPRAGQAMMMAARVRALMEGRYNLSFEDIRAVAPACLRHRVALNFEGLAEGQTVDGLLLTLMDGLKT